MCSLKRQEQEKNNWSKTRKILVLAENEENISLGWEVLAWLTASQLDKTKIQHLKLQSLHYEFVFLYWDGIVY